MTKQELIEALADKEHASWARWMRYLFSRCTRNPDGGLVISVDDAVHWLLQTVTDYAWLTDAEKESDRKEVAHILPIIERYVEQETARDGEVSTPGAVYVRRATGRMY